MFTVESVNDKREMITQLRRMLVRYVCLSMCRHKWKVEAKLWMDGQVQVKSTKYEPIHIAVHGNKSLGFASISESDTLGLQLPTTRLVEQQTKPWQARDSSGDIQDKINNIAQTYTQERLLRCKYGRVLSTKFRQTDQNTFHPVQLCALQHHTTPVSSHFFFVHILQWRKYEKATHLSSTHH